MKKSHSAISKQRTTFRVSKKKKSIDQLMKMKPFEIVVLKRNRNIYKLRETNYNLNEIKNG
mgnify:CR=1 FL=1